MDTIRTARSIVILLCCSVTIISSANAQLDSVFHNMFQTLLGPASLQKVSGGHQNHFIPAANKADSSIIHGLNSMIEGNIASFPLSSTSSPVLFDLSTGIPIPITNSLGPIMGETAEPLGAGKIALGASYTYLDLASIRGLPLDQMQFTFTHQLVGKDTELGESHNESDLITVTTDLHVRAQIAAIIATAGVTKDLDLSVALPIISITLSGTAKAVITSYTFAYQGYASHFFAGPGSDSTHPLLETKYSYSNTATGIGDLAVRAKYSFAHDKDLNFAALLDVRLPTGKTENYLGSGKMAAHVWGIISGRTGDMTPHLNLGYERNPADFQSDLFEFRAGFDNKLSSHLTFALDIMGGVDLSPSKTVHLVQNPVTIYDGPNKKLATPVDTTTAVAVRSVPQTNVPDSYDDSIYNVSLGVRYSPVESVMTFFNVLVPLNNKGLRAPLAPTIGFSALF